MPNARCFLDFSVEGESVGRVIFELFSDLVPKTCENFRSLCTGIAGVNSNGDSLYYKGSPIHRIIQGFCVQGGDFTTRNGKGSESIYGGTFDDERLGDIDREGLLVMANKGKNTNGSQFFVSLRPTPHLAGKHVIFGKVVKGYEIIEGLSKLPVNEKDHPIQMVLISNCGELELRKAPVKKARSVTPVSDRSRSRSRSRSHSVSSSRSRSRSRSRSPEPRKRSKKSHRERDENGKKIKREKSSKHRSSKRSRREEEDKEEAEGKPKELTEAELEEMEERKRLVELEMERKKEDEEREKVKRERQLLELKKRYERNDGGGSSSVNYKGRGSMKAPDANGRSGGMRGW